MKQTKRCTKCQKLKLLIKFHIQSTGRYGRHSQCKECVNRNKRLTKKSFDVTKLSKDKIRKIVSLIGKKDKNGCKYWLGQTDRDGYGRISINGIHLSTHRLVWMIKNNKNLTRDVLILHSCDNPSCCNHRHLRPGTVQDNVDDMVKKGRNVIPLTKLKGEDHPQAVFTGKDVRRMRKLREQGKTYAEIGRIFDKSGQQIWVIINKTWSHII